MPGNIPRRSTDRRHRHMVFMSLHPRIPEREWDGQDQEMHFFTVSDRSAEAYWVQCILSLMLPSGDLPMGVCTGTVNYKGGEYEIGIVEGVAAKLEYANRAGFTRAIVPGESRDYYEDDPFNKEEAFDDSEQQGDPVNLHIETEEAADPEDQPEENSHLHELTDAERIKRELKDFLERLRAQGSLKTIEVNFARTARAASDAMQPAGWRRTNFLRTPEFQRMFSRNQWRLFIRDALLNDTNSPRLKPSEIQAYKRNKWRENEERSLKILDKNLQSQTDRAVVLISRNTIRRIMPSISVDEAMGAWAAWKDNQVRNGTNGYREPGLGVVALRTAEGDTETRIWAALAEILVADEGWWEQFQWANLPKAAELLAKLLCNYQADPNICQESAPDLLIVFDDCGFATQRLNEVFPSEFRHQFIDLLNPRLPTNNKKDYLDSALKDYSQNNRAFNTRVIVVLREDTPTTPTPTHDKMELPDAERTVLERLALFRFGCNRHAGFAIANFETSHEDRLDWPNYVEVVRKLKRRKLLAVTRNIIYLTPKGRRLVSGGVLASQPCRLAKAHRHAALALCPILSPSGVRISTNRDRQLEPENVLEANWHLQQAFNLVPWRFSKTFWNNTSDRLPSVPDLQAQLTFMRTMPDWDTVKRLRVNRATRQDSVDLSRELLKSQEDILGHQPPSPVVGLTIETMGRVFQHETQSPPTIKEKVGEIVSLVDTAMCRLKKECRLSKEERRRRFRHLLSRQLFALRMLGLGPPLQNRTLRPARKYLDRSVDEILQPHFLENLRNGNGSLNKGIIYENPNLPSGLGILDHVDRAQRTPDQLAGRRDRPVRLPYHEGFFKLCLGRLVTVRLDPHCRAVFGLGHWVPPQFSFNSRSCHALREGCSCLASSSAQISRTNRMRHSSFRSAKT